MPVHHKENGVVWIVVFGDVPQDFLDNVIAVERAAAEAVIAAEESTQDGKGSAAPPPLVCPRRSRGRTSVTVPLGLTAAAVVAGLFVIPAQQADSGPPGGGSGQAVSPPTGRVPALTVPPTPPVAFVDPLPPVANQSARAAVTAPPRAGPGQFASPGPTTGTSAAATALADAPEAARARRHNGGPPCSLLCLLGHMLNAD